MQCNFGMVNSNQLPLIGISRLRMGIDGDGVRTLVCTQGCPLRCKYCLNPFSWDGSSKVKNYTIKKLYDEVKIDNLYFQATKGGITFGGGEPLLHIDAIEEFIKICPDTWNIWVETSLHVSEDAIHKASGLFDHFVVDIKTTNPTIYQEYTEGDFNIAWNNLLLLKELVGVDKITVRVPLIPNYVDEKQQNESEQILRESGFKNIDAFTYSIRKR